MLQTDLSGSPTFSELLVRVRDVSQAAYAHQDLPFEKLVENLAPNRDPSRNPLFDVTFGLQSYEKQSLTLSGLTVTAVELDIGTTQFDLSLFAELSSDGLALTLRYNRDLFDPQTASRLFGCFEVLLEAVVKDPDRSVLDIPLLREDEIDSILSSSRNTRPYPRDLSIHELFQEQAERTPDALAVVFQGEHLTYRELDERANQLARYLRKLGVGHETLVGVYLDRSEKLIVAMLAILKAGGAYLPLNPADPAHRLSVVLEDAAVTVVVAEKTELDELPFGAVEVVWLDANRGDIDRMSRDKLDNPASAKSLAYLMYTSGSTGRPKGTLIPHRAVIRLVCETDYVRLGPSDVVAQASNFAFDASTFEVWGALLNGALLSIISNEVVLSPAEMSRHIGREGVTTMFLTTALFHLMSRERPEAFGSIGSLLVGGETLSPKWAKRVLDKAPPGRLVHCYGPTETTTFATWHEVSNVRDGATTIPIGGPIANTEVYVLDKGLRPVPEGVVGEIYIGGDGLARGYLNEPELTAKSFIGHPFDEGAVLYRTGDLARRLTDGTIDMIGRIDDQVKIRGFRVEPGEVKAVLSHHPAVQDVLVIARSGPTGARPSAVDQDRRLVAYVVTKATVEPTVNELKQFLREHIPNYMVPSSFVMMDEFPLNSNGKVSRSELPAPAEKTPQGRSIATKDEVEVRLLILFKRVLGVQDIALNDSFFDLGGHSLLAASLVTQINKLLDTNLTFISLFEAPSVAELSKVIRKGEWSRPTSAVVAVQPHGSNPPLFCAGPAYACYQLASYLGTDQPIYELKFPSLDSSRLPSDQLKELATQCIPEIKKTQPEGPYYVGGYSGRGGNLALEIAQQLLEKGDDIALLTVFDAAAPGALKRQAIANAGRPLYQKAIERLTVHAKRVRSLGLKDRVSYVSRLARLAPRWLLPSVSESH